MNYPKIFISYRRSNGEDKAILLYKILAQAFPKGYIFFDREKLELGEFPNQIETALKNSTHFVLLMTKGSLNRCCNEPDDWLRREISIALNDSKRIIIPVETEDFKCKLKLPNEIEKILVYQRIRWSREYVEHTLEKIQLSIQKSLCGSASFLDNNPNSNTPLITRKVSTDAGTLDFTLSDKMLVQIKKILMKSPKIETSWPITVGIILGATAEKHDLEYKSGRDMQEWITEILEKYVLVNGDAATFNKLCELLRKANNKYAADKLKAKAVMIRTLDNLNSWGL